MKTFLFTWNYNHSIEYIVVLANTLQEAKIKYAYYQHDDDKTLSVEEMLSWLDRPKIKKMVAWNELDPTVDDVYYISEN